VTNVCVDLFTTYEAGKTKKEEREEGQTIF